jgi:hypothetical protein
MMSYYFVKRDLYGIKAGHVERFNLSRAGMLLAEGAIEPFDPKKHGNKPGAECVPVVSKTA